MNRQNIISIIVSIAAIIVAGFTWFRNADQTPQAYAIAAQPISEIKADTIGLLDQKGVYRLWKVLYTRPVQYTLTAKGLPTYDSLMINETHAKNVWQKGERFDPKSFIEHTHNANRVVDYWIIR